MAICSSVPLDEQTSPSTQLSSDLYKNAGLQPVERHVESSVATICPLIRDSTDTSEADPHIARLTSRYTSSRHKKKEKAEWIAAMCVVVMTPALSSVIAVAWRSWKTSERNDKGFVNGSNTHFIKACRRKPKHDRSNTGLNAFSSFPIFSFHISVWCPRSLASVMENYCRSISPSAGVKGSSLMSLSK